MMETSASRDPDALALHPAVKAYSKDVAKRLARAHRARPDGSDAATEAFLAEIADGLERWQGRETDDDDPDKAAADAERAAAAGDTAATIDFTGRAMARKGRRVMREAAETEAASGAGPLTLFFVEPGTLVTNELLSEAAGYPKSPVLEPDAPLPPGVEPVGGYLAEQPEGFNPDDPSTYDIVTRCLREALGIEQIVNLAGAPVIPKGRAGVAGGGRTSRTSPASIAFRHLFPQRLPFTLWAPTLLTPFATTRILGVFLGRAVPLVGWGLMLNDTRRFFTCLSESREHFELDDFNAKDHYP